MKNALNTVVIYDTRAAAKLLKLSDQYLRHLLTQTEGTHEKVLRGLTFKRYGGGWIAFKTGVHDVHVITGD